MSAAGALKAGEAFIRFFGDFSDLMRDFKTLTSEAPKWGQKFTKEGTDKMVGGLDNAKAAAAAFSDQATASSTVATTAMQNVANSAMAASGAVAEIETSAKRSGGALGMMGGAVSGLQGFAKNLFGANTALASIGKFAGLASWGLRGASLAGRLFGKDMSHLEPWIKNLNRISWAAWGVNTALRAASLTAAGFKALASLPGRAVGALGSFAGRFGRMGGAAAAVSAVSGAATTPEGEKANTGASIASGAMSGMMMGGIVGAGVGAAAVGLGVTIKEALSRGAKEGARESKDFLTQLGVAMIDLGTWATGTWNKIYTKFQTIMASMKTEGPSVFDRIRKAILPISDAVTNVWLPAMMSAMDTVAAYFKGGTKQMGRSWMDWIMEIVGGIADFVANFDLYFQYAQQSIVMWAGNAILQVEDFFTNAAAWADWFGENWYDILMTMADYAMTAFLNMGDNIGNAFSEIWKFIESMGQEGLDFNFKKLDDGFVSTIKEWPKKIETALESSSPEMDAIAKKLLDRQNAFKDRSSKGPVASIKAASGELEKQSKSPDSRFAAISAGSTDGAAVLARLQNGQATTAAQKQKETLTTQKKISSTLDRIERNTGNIKVGGGWEIAP